MKYDKRYVVYSIRPKSEKKVTHQAYEDLSEAQNHAKQLRRLYGNFIQVGVDEEVSRLRKSICKLKEILKRNRDGKNQI